MQNVSISFVGQFVAQAMVAHADVVQAIGRYCEDLPRGNISVYVNERVSNEQLEWPVVVRGQQGQQTVVAIQTSPGSVVKFSSKELA